jgi:hypothetical protein
MAQRKNVTDRAHRYRANALAPAGPRVCALCGSRSNITVDHIDGHPDHTERKNLRFLCKKCNTARGIWMRDHGKGRLTHQYNPASKGPPSYEQYAWAVANQQHSGEHGGAGAIIHATPAELRSEYARRIAAKARGTKRARAERLRRLKEERDRIEDMQPEGQGIYKGNPWPFSDKRLSARQTTPATGGAAYHTARRKPDDLNREFLKKSKAELEERAGKRGAKKGKPEWIQRMELREGNAAKKRKRNPADLAADAFKEFHGHDSKELVIVSKKIHHHTHLAAAGELRGLSVKPIGHGLPVRHIGGLKGALLAFNEAKNQLFIEGGDQFMDDAELKKFGIRNPHEIETLGKVTALDYFTTKTHLGSEGGTAVYAHKLRTTNQDGQHVTVTIARYPDLIYRVMDQQFEFSGGSYEIRAEGIDK